MIIANGVTVKEQERIWNIESISMQSVCGVSSTCKVQLKDFNGKVHEQSVSSKNGQVDALYKCIDKIVGVEDSLVDYKVSSVTNFEDALGRVTVLLDSDKIQKDLTTGEIHSKTFKGIAIDTDIIFASAKAYMNAINQKLVETQRFELNKQPEQQSVNI